MIGEMAALEDIEGIIFSTDITHGSGKTFWLSNVITILEISRKNITGELNRKW